MSPRGRHPQQEAQASRSSQAAPARQPAEGARVARPAARREGDRRATGSARRGCARCRSRSRRSSSARAPRSSSTDCSTGCIALFCLIVSVSLQIGVNYANDYSDGIRGTDDHRVGPARLTASRKVTPRAVLIAALIFFAIAAVAGPRDRDPHPAVVAAAGRRRLHRRRVVLHRRQAPVRLLRPRRAVRLRVLRARRDASAPRSCRCSPCRRRRGSAPSAAGLLACAVLLANNLRDIDQDRAAAQAHAHGADRPPRRRACCSRCSCSSPFAIAGYLALFYPIAWLTLLALLAALPAILIVWTYRVPARARRRPQPHVADVGRLRRVPAVGVHRLSRRRQSRRLADQSRSRRLASAAASSASSSLAAPPALGALGEAGRHVGERAAQEQQRQAQADERGEDRGEPVHSRKIGNSIRMPNGTRNASSRSTV